MSVSKERTGVWQKCLDNGLMRQQLHGLPSAVLGQLAAETQAQLSELGNEQSDSNK